MTPQTALAPAISENPYLPLIGRKGALERLEECGRVLREHVRTLRGEDSPPDSASRWLLDNHAFIQSQILDIRRSLRPAYMRRIIQAGEGCCAEEPRIYRVVADLVQGSRGVIDYSKAQSFSEDLKEHSLEFSELWAFGLMLRLVLVERLSRHLHDGPTISDCVRSLAALEGVSWREFVESASVTEDLLRKDPANIYPGMDFETRDLYRHTIEKLSRRNGLTEKDVATALLENAGSALRSGVSDTREHHIGFYLIGPGARVFRERLDRRWPVLAWIRDLPQQWPSLFYACSFLFLTAIILAGFARFTGPVPKWLLAIALIPASQAALEIVNAAIGRLLKPRTLPSMDFSAGIPADRGTLVVVPTLLLSPANVTRLLENLEIRYLANRDHNLCFGLLTDFPDSDAPEPENHSVLTQCVEGIERLNARYGLGQPGPFYLFHRALTWNPREGKWIGFERKRGKLNDLNRLLLGESNWFKTIAGDMSRLTAIRYVITLDTDTQLPRDSAAKMVGAMAHPLNRPLLDPETKIVTEGYALVRPRVAVGMESAWRSRIAQIFSGQPGFDPYATSVSDVYQDLHGQASFTGKGIYDVRAFHAAVGDRFPENAILSHDLIEGEHARTGLLTSVEVVEDYPATYKAFSKRKHRWVRGDWQLLPWLLSRPPLAAGRSPKNPLSLLSRWKIVDNLRRSLFEISIVWLLVAGFVFIPHSARWTLGVLLILQLPAYADLLLTLAKTPERQFLQAFRRNLGRRFAQSHRDTLLTLAFIPHQACLMADAIVRTLGRMFVTKRKLLEWETMAQSESAAATRNGLVERYLYLSSFVWLAFLFGFERLNLLVALVCSLWVVAPLIVGWLNEPLPAPEALRESDRAFLRDVALRTWRFFADYADEKHNWLIPDNVQQDPPLVADGISPTNLGLLLTSTLAANDFGYLNVDQLSRSLQRIFDSMAKLPRYRGHFLNWYNTRSLSPMPHRYVSSVDSGNLAASLCALRQGCLSILKEPVFGGSILAGLRDHALRLRDELPYSARTQSLMRLIAGLLRQLDCQPTDLFFWEAMLTDARDIVQRIRETLVATHAHLRRQSEQGKSDEVRYWECLLSERINSALAELYSLAPWLEPAFEPELRVNMRDPGLAELFALIGPAPRLTELPETCDRICELIGKQLANPGPLYPRLRQVLEQLRQRLPEARASALELIERLESIAELSSGFVEEMDFHFLFDGNRKLLRIGYNLDAGQADEACYDLLASEARTAVFLAIAKGDIPREAWFRLSRKLTAYRGQRTLLSWSGTMFEYLMPLLHLPTYSDTLLDNAMRGAVRIQQLYAGEQKVPWGISESAHSERDGRRQYQYRAFGVPALSASADRPNKLVIAPYASMLAVMLEPARSAANLRALAAAGYEARHGFVEAIDYSAGTPETIHCFMAHHQGMGLVAIDNAVFSGRMQERFHLEPFVQATEFLLQERMPALVEDLSDAGEQSAAA